MAMEERREGEERARVRVVMTALTTDILGVLFTFTISLTVVVVVAEVEVVLLRSLVFLSPFSCSVSCWSCWSCWSWWSWCGTGKKSTANPTILHHTLTPSTSPACAEARRRSTMIVHRDCEWCMRETCHWCEDLSACRDDSSHWAAWASMWGGYVHVCDGDGVCVCVDVRVFTLMVLIADDDDDEEERGCVGMCLVITPD